MILSDFEYYKTDLGVLLCGDCLEILPLIKEPISVTFADPPYNIGFDYDGYDDNKSFSEYNNLCRKWISILKNKSKLLLITPGTNNYYLYDHRSPLGITYWLNRTKRMRAKIHHFSKIERVYIYGELDNKYPMDYIIADYKKDPLAEGAPCPKPIELYEKMIINQYPGEIILDPFASSGTIGVVGERLQRPWIGIELSEKYCEIAKKRIEAEANQIKLDL